MQEHGMRISPLRYPTTKRRSLQQLHARTCISIYESQDRLSTWRIQELLHSFPQPNARGTVGPTSTLGIEGNRSFQHPISGDRETKGAKLCDLEHV
jgi:hypothetical protein